MTEKEKADMMAEIMNIVDKHVNMSENNTHTEEGDSRNMQFSKDARTMAEWKEEYKKIRVEGKTILDEVRNNPINVEKLDCSFDVGNMYDEFQQSLKK